MDNTKPFRILLVEDEPSLRELYERVLLQAGFLVKTAHDGIAGLTLAKEQPDLILLDIMMPNLNGIEVLERLQKEEETKTICVVLLTNLGQGSIIRKALENGARGYIMKLRVSPYELIEEVKKFLLNPTFKTDYETLNLE